MDHVKGHRDSQILYTSLRPLPAQLNVDADSLATKELQEQPRLIHHIPLFPHNKVQLELLSGTSLTRKLSGAIHKRQGYRNLIPYMFDWYGWTANITDSVDWDWFAAAHKLCLQQRKFVFKFCMSLLPTEKTLHWRESHFGSRCLERTFPQESNDHLFQCPNISRQHWQSSTISALRKMLETNDTNLVLVDIMMAGLG